jgi:hypothetical protein
MVIYILINIEKLVIIKCSVWGGLLRQHYLMVCDHDFEDRNKVYCMKT